MENVKANKYLGIQLDGKLEWSTNTEVIYKKGLSQRYFLRKLRSFNEILHMYYQAVVASIIFYTVVCWGGGITVKDDNRLNKVWVQAGYTGGGG